MIKQSSIKNVSPHLPIRSTGKRVVCALANADQFSNQLTAIGFGTPLNPGEQVLPTAIGRISTFNAEGAEIIRKDLPMETRYRQIVWHWKEWHGQDRVEKEGIRAVRYKRFPREQVPPPSVELTVATDLANNPYVVAPAILNEPENYDALKHVVNLFLEIFGQCEILQEDLSSFVATKVIRLPWTILPPGRNPWDQVLLALHQILSAQPPTTTAILEYRFRTIYQFKPDFVAYGNAGFAGYLVLAFEQKELFVMESPFLDNATYVFKGEWQRFTTMTKAEILNQKLPHARLIHSKGWAKEITNLLLSG
jgi:hypothetical protein